VEKVPKKKEKGREKWQEELFSTGAGVKVSVTQATVVRAAQCGSAVLRVRVWRRCRRAECSGAVAGTLKKRGGTEGMLRGTRARPCVR